MPITLDREQLEKRGLVAINYETTADDLIVSLPCDDEFACRMLLLVKNAISHYFETDTPMFFNLDGIEDSDIKDLQVTGIQYTRRKIIFSVAMPEKYVNDLRVQLPGIKVSEEVMIPLKRCK